MPILPMLATMQLYLFVFSQNPIPFYQYSILICHKTQSSTKEGLMPHNQILLFEKNPESYVQLKYFLWVYLVCLQVLKIQQNEI
jgi:hypothetical protein